MNKAEETNTTTTATTAQTTFINQSQSKDRASFPKPESGPAVDPPSYPLSNRAKAFFIDIPSASPPSTRSTNPTLEYGHEMSSKHSHSIAHDEWAGPIPSSTMRNSMSFHRPAFVHTSTNYHAQQSLNANGNASASTSSLPLQQSTLPANQSLSQTQGAGAGAGPYRDHPSTKEEYPNSDPTTNPYAQAFPPRTHTPSRRHATSAHSRQSSFGAWESVCCRLADVRRRMCCKEGALGRALMMGWVLTTVGFLLACAFWKGELFTALDDLSKQLYSLGYQGQLIFGLLIFITTIPPLPLYSTLMVLCGYTFGVWEAFVVSYIASLVGAVVVFIVSRTLLRDVITKSLQNSPMAMSLLHIIPAKPHLLLLIRVAPYPYNLLNVILASSPSLTLRTYTACTALSLCKLVIHTWIGAGLHDLSELHGGGAGHGDGSSLSMEDQQRQDVRWYSTCFGVVLCISLFFYLTHLAKRAVARAQSEHEAREIRCPGQGHVFLREEEA